MRTRDVAVLILHDRGRTLLQKRAKDEPRFPDSWGLFGGALKDGETVLDALFREAREEAGLILAAAEVVASQPYDLPENGEAGTVHVCLARYDGGALSLNEGQGMAWFDPSEAVNVVGHSIYRGIIEQIVQKRIRMVS